jgi:hypothetical protein
LSRDAESVLCSTSYDGTGTLTELAFSGVKSGVETTCSWTNWVEGTVVDCILGVELSVDVTSIRFFVTVETSMSKKGDEERKLKKKRLTTNTSHGGADSSATSQWGGMAAKKCLRNQFSF